MRAIRFRLHPVRFVWGVFLPSAANAATIGGKFIYKMRRGGIYIKKLQNFTPFIVAIVAIVAEQQNLEGKLRNNNFLLLLRCCCVARIKSKNRPTSFLGGAVWLPNRDIYPPIAADRIAGFVENIRFFHFMRFTQQHATTRDNKRRLLLRKKSRGFRGVRTRGFVCCDPSLFDSTIARL
jgi:hypothetical protein